MYETRTAIEMTDNISLAKNEPQIRLQHSKGQDIPLRNIKRLSLVQTTCFDDLLPWLEARTCPGST